MIATRADLTDIAVSQGAVSHLHAPAALPLLGLPPGCGLRFRDHLVDDPSRHPQDRPARLLARGLVEPVPVLARDWRVLAFAGRWSSIAAPPYASARSECRACSIWCTTSAAWRTCSIATILFHVL